MTGSARACSGARYAAVPSTEPCAVSAVESCEWAMPKSPSFTVPSRAAEDVRRLDVAVDEPGGVRRGQRGRELTPEVDHLARGQPPAPRELLRERLAVDVLHRDEQARLVAAGVVDLHDVRVRDARGEPRLAQEPGPKALVVGQVLREHLERDRPSEHRVVREIDGRHTAAAERALDRVPATAGGRRMLHPPESFP